MLTRLVAHVKRLFQHDAIDAEVDEELRFHVDMETQANMARGMTAGEARRVALRDLGGVTQTREAIREVSVLGFGWTDDLRLTFRTMRRNPGFVVVAVVVLALGCAITGVVFSTVNGWVSVGRAIPGADRVVVLAHADEEGVHPDRLFRETEYARLFALKLRTVKHLFALRPFPALLTTDASTENVRVEAIAGSYFAALGVPPHLGRPLYPDDDRGGGSIVLGEGAWRRLFNGNAGVIGRSVRLSGLVCTVVGVMPERVRGFTMPSATSVDVWAPVGVVRSLIAPSGQPVWGQVFGRLADGASLAEARAEAQVVAARLDPDHPALHAVPLAVESGVFPTRMRLLFGAMATGLVALSSLVLLIACANLANLLLARSASRSAEIAIRMALGASPIRILRLQLLESAAVAALGGAGGIGLVWWVSRAAGQFTILVGGQRPIRASLLVDGWVLSFFFLLVVFSSVAIGILPALRAIRIDPVQVLASSGTRGRSTGRFERKRTWLVASQVAASVVLLVVAGLFVRSALRASSYHVAFDASHLAVGHLNWTAPGLDEELGRQRQDRLLAVARSVPGVRAAAVASALPAGGGGELLDIETEEANLGAREFGPPCRAVSVSPGFFEAMRPLRLRGRAFSEQDGRADRGVAIVNDVAAERLWPGRDPIGRRLRIRKGPGLDVVGVVAETDRTAASTTERCCVFVPMEQRFTPEFIVMVAGTSPAASLVGPLSTAIRRAVPDAAMYDVETAEADLNRAGGLSRTVALALVALGGLGLGIAMVGLYAVTAYVVGLRRAEFGIRKVLGATNAQVYGVVFRETGRMLAIGIGVGLPLAFAVSSSVAGALVGVTEHDALTYLLVPACLAAVGFVAAWWPARRAARIEPVEALRDL